MSEQSGINLFIPRPSPSIIEGIEGDVVFAIAEKLLHNYLLPRDCPRVTYYESASTTPADKERFMGATSARNVITVESGWYEAINSTTLFCYELPAATFLLIDECAGYYVSHAPVKPVGVRKIEHLILELLARNVELRFTPILTKLAKDVAASSLNFSLIRMLNAKK